MSESTGSGMMGQSGIKPSGTLEGSYRNEFLGEASPESRHVATARLWLPEDPAKLKAEEVKQLARSMTFWAAWNMDGKKYDLASMELELAWRLAEKLKEVDR